jgi:hypothetical protein
VDGALPSRLSRRARSIVFFSGMVMDLRFMDRWDGWRAF